MGDQVQNIFIDYMNNLSAMKQKLQCVDGLCLFFSTLDPLLLFEPIPNVRTCS